MNVGAQLRASREARGISIDALSHATRVQPRILAAIERNDVAAVPPRPFGRGFVRAYAQEIGLDPDGTAREYLAQFGTAAPAAAHTGADVAPSVDSSTRWPLAAMAIGGLAIVALLVFISRAPRAPVSNSAPPPVGTSGSAPAPAPPSIAPTASTTPVPVDTAAPPVPVDTAAPPSSGLSIVISADRRSWVTASADGKRVLYQNVLPGTPVTISAREFVRLRVGDAGALSWRINGRDAGRLGRPGQVRNIRVTPDTAAAAR